MRNRSVAIIILAFLAFAGASAIRAQVEEKKVQEKVPVTAHEVLKKLAFSSRISKPKETLNSELIASIKERGVDFVLDERLIRDIKEHGGSEALLAAIEDGLPDETKGWMKDFIRLEAIIRDNYPRIDTRRLAVEAGRELIEKYNDERYGCSDFVQWLKIQLPKWAEQVKEYDDPIHPRSKPKPMPDQPHRR